MHPMTEASSFVGPGFERSDLMQLPFPPLSHGSLTLLYKTHTTRFTWHPMHPASAALLKPPVQFGPPMRRPPMPRTPS